LPNNSYLEDNYIIGNCSYFYNQSFTYGTNNYSSFNFCRAFGNPILFNFASGGAAVDPKLYNNTITSNGDVMIQTSGTCSGRSVLVKNNLLLGGRQAQDDDDKTSIFYNADGTCAATFTEDYNTCSNTFKEASPCPASHSKNNIAPSSTYSGTITEGPTTYYNGSSYLGQLTLKATSTAIDTALSSLSGADSYGFGIAPQERGGTWDMGALDYAAGAAVCGNSIIETGETCDDSNASSTDGCSSSCLIETGYSCTGTPSTCTAICGDGLVKAAEGCDDANVISADGCSSTCTVESGYGCVGTAPSVCTPTGGGGGGVTGPSGKFTASGRFSY
jgi:cysteine-rich repeat protein